MTDITAALAARRAGPPLRIDLALQGGGSHGAFTWGVPDRAGNPTMTPLVQDCESRDTLPVQINPVIRAETPRTARDIASRLNEISFNAQLLKELRMMAIPRRVIDPGLGEAKAWRDMRMHRITSDVMTSHGHSSKMNAEWPFLEMLFVEGRRAASEFGKSHLTDMGVKSNFDIDTLLDAV